MSTPVVDFGALSSASSENEEIDLLAQLNEGRAEHACSYCGCEEAQSSVQCLECNKWFCNGTFNTAGSHIVNHLVRARHRTISLHLESPIGDAPLECYQCGGRNIFVLGFVASDLEDTVILLCRDSCRVNSSQTISDHSSWSPLIQDRQLLSWLARLPEGPGNFSLSCSVTAINKLEDRWMQGERSLQIDQLANDLPGLGGPGLSGLPEPVAVPLQFADGAEYWQLFVPLLELEAKADRHLKENVGNFSNKLKIADNLRFCYIPIPRRDDAPPLLLGDELRLSTSSALGAGVPGSVVVGGVGFTITAYVVKLSREEATLEFKRRLTKKEAELSDQWSISYVWKSTTFDRMRAALRRFANDPHSVSTHLYHAVLGRAAHLVTAPAVDHVHSLAGLNASQLYAVRRALETGREGGLCLIQGPPGTGKSTVSVAIVKELSRKSQVLVCAPSNTAADHLAERLDKAGVNVVRLMARSREDVYLIENVGSNGSGGVATIMLHNKQKQQILGTSELGKLQRLREEIGEFVDEKDKQRYEKLKRKSEMEILSKADAIVTTCVGAGDGRLSDFRFKCVLIDEATQATEPETLIPMVHGCKALILVGDHKQLGSVIIDKKAAKAGLKRSLFERMIDLNLRPIRLEIQYRMHPSIADFPSAQFYEGSLQSAVSASDRYLGKFPFPAEGMPQMFYHVAGASEELSGSGTSYLNRAEASAVAKMVSLFVTKSGVGFSDIGIITPYDGQKQYLMQVLSSEVEQGLEISSGDSFQGREKEVVVISMVRANALGVVGFVADARRLNVALTRARRALVVCGCAQTLVAAGSKDKKNAVALALLRHFKKINALVEGPVGNFRPAMIPFPRETAGAARARNPRARDMRSESSDVASVRSLDSFEVRSQR